jgi:mRNA interferase MazF
VARGYVPDAGDIVWLRFTPQVGHEQAGHRPALVVSPAAYNGKSGLMLCCPMTSRIKGYPFEVVLDSKPASVVLADQVKSLDWAAREASPKGRATDAELAAVRARIVALVGGVARKSQ